MDQKDVQKLWLLLGEYYGKPKETKEHLAAWTLALEPFTYEQVRAEALKHARKSPFFPKICELTGNLPQPRDNSWMDEYM